jgi:hypothetical protein
MRKREWHYLLPPAAFELRCNICSGGRVWWSEYEHMIFCFDCQLDVDGTESLFDGPILLKTSYLLGLNFDRYNLTTNQIERLNLEKSDVDGIKELIYDDPKEVERNKVLAKERTIELLKTGEEILDPYGEGLNRYGKKYFKLVPGEKEDGQT